MNLRKVSFFILFLVLAVASCKKDDPVTEVIVEIEDRTEQQLKDMDSLNKYLENHYYNSEYIESLGTNASISDIEIKKLETGQTDAPVGYTMLKKGDVLAPKLVKYSVKYEDTDYEYFVLNLNIGGGINSPKFSDKIRFNYEGFTLEDAVFDYSVFPFDSDLVGNGVTTFGLIPGWKKIMPSFKTAESFVENSDGTISYTNKGLGVMFLPSGLAYFSNATTGIPAYSPIIFKFELLQMFENDHDGDGIPSYLEGADDDFEFTLNTDEDFTSDSYGNVYPRYNYIDNDDDGDGKLTKDEIIITTFTADTVEAVRSKSLAYNEVLLNKIIDNRNGTYTGTIIKFKDTVVGEPFDYLDKDN
ncbi:FKBP-type peptidyl-prolyl cis-trans isomerase [Mariniflexile jejuense]|uniref:peptidylprolyl isomerase n=1 Tax=Mariniflexile jejuense TaxID=1173582 RepID=A0ABW3JKW3_9FLAO